MENNDIIEWKKCKQCGFIQYKSHYRCLKCKNKTFDIVRATGKAKLITYTVLNAPPLEFFDKKSYPLGIIEFENGVKLLGQLTTKENLRIGMEVKIMYQKICDSLDGKEVYGHIIKPID